MSGPHDHSHVIRNEDGSVYQGNGWYTYNGPEVHEPVPIGKIKELEDRLAAMELDMAALIERLDEWEDAR